MILSLLTTHGRLRRTHYIAAVLSLTTITAYLLELTQRLNSWFQLAVIVGLISLHYWISFCLSAKRSHDHGEGTQLALLAFGLLLLATCTLSYAFYSGFATSTLTTVAGYIGYFAMLASSVLGLKIAFGPARQAGDKYGLNPRKR